MRVPSFGTTNGAACGSGLPMAEAWVGHRERVNKYRKYFGNTCVGARDSYMTFGLISALHTHFSGYVIMRSSAQ
jgi:hypothetical protein